MTDKSKYLLACESSCDETAFSLYNITTKSIVKSTIHSQIKMHARHGGVIPELASQFHFNIISELFYETLAETSIALEDIDYFACTNGPGLPGALLIGFTFVKTLAWSLQKPFFSINHLEGHLYSTFLSSSDIPFPHLCMSLSGGHSNIYLVESFDSYVLLGTTRDDACGECFDKIAKLLNLPYPGGKYIEEITKNNILKNSRNYTISNLQDGSISFSGLKTAVLYDIMKNNYYDKEKKKISDKAPIEFAQEIATSTQYVITHMIINWIYYFVEQYPHIKAITMVGGVACNEIIAHTVEKYFESHGIHFYRPEKKFCCDNADMIALVAAHKIKKNSNIENIYNQSILT